MEKRSKRNFRSAMHRRGTALMLAALTVFSVAACGKTEGAADSAVKKEWVYVPEFITVEEGNVSYYDMQLTGENVYYLTYDWNEETQEQSQRICRYSLADKSVTSHVIAMGEESGRQDINRGYFLEDGTMYAIAYSYSEDYSESFQCLTMFDAEGKQKFSQDITELSGDSYLDSLAVDGEGRIYVSSEGKVLLFDAEGNSKGSVIVDNTGNTWIDTLVRGKDGKVYIGYSNYDGNTSSYTLCEVDFDGKKMGASYENFPRSSSLAAGVEYDFLISNGREVSGYNLGQKEAEYLFDWLDSDINGNSVRKFSQLEDGRVIAVIEDWENNDRGIALLTKKKAEEAPQKETITIATMGGSYSLQSKAVKFNKANSQYHISVKEYVNYDNSNENTWSDALTNLNNDITSANCPDLIDLSSVNIEQLTAKGVLEDLNPYLEKSGKLNKSDFVENILNAYTFNGALISIPVYFNVQTVVGAASMVGSESGWTLDELIALSNAHPDAELFDRVSKQYILRMAMMFNGDSFIDWNTGECSFDSDAFKNILEFVNKFPDEIKSEEGMDSEPTRIQNGEVLLATSYIYDFNQLQMYNEIFKGDYNCIGFPTVDGTGGHALSGGDAYAITAKSGHKDGAWEFLESILTEEDNERYWNGFPTIKTRLDNMKKKAMEPDYILDENGEILKDENGEPMISEGTSSVGYEDGWSYTYRKPTQEEIDKVVELMDNARPVSYNGNDEITKIINEEAEGFFKGQKSVDEVVGIIQNRVKIYVGETK